MTLIRVVYIDLYMPISMPDSYSLSMYHQFICTHIYIVDQCMHREILEESLPNDDDLWWCIHVAVIISNLYFCWLFEFLIMYVEFYQKVLFSCADSMFFLLNNSYGALNATV